jgi:mono/diheme cytochrome c family protein
LRTDRVILLLLLCAVLTLAGCQQKMRRQPKHKPLSPSTFFADGKSARPLVANTVPRGSIIPNTAYTSGKDANKEYVTALPFSATTAELQRGQLMFNIYCSPCHAKTGTGDGMIVRRGYTRPPSFHEDRMLTAPVGHFVDVMTNGFARMPDYALQVPLRDRWSIAAYTRALQLSQRVPVANLSEAERKYVQDGTSGTTPTKQQAGGGH